MTCRLHLWAYPAENGYPSHDHYAGAIKRLEAERDQIEGKLAARPLAVVPRIANTGIDVGYNLNILYTGRCLAQDPIGVPTRAST